MAFDAFLKISTIPGESTDSAHAGQIEIISYSHGVSQRGGGPSSTAGGRAAERCDHAEFSVVKLIDKASPKLFLACCKGDHIPTITLDLCRAAADKTRYMQYVLSDVIVASVRPSGASRGAEPLPLEEVSFNYGKIEYLYTETDHKTGQPKGDVRAHWDLTINKGG